MIPLIDRPFTFFTAQSLHDCHQSLKHLPLRVRTLERANDTVMFSLYWSVPYGRIAFVRGTVTEDPGGDRLVRGYGRVPLISCFLFAYFIVVGIVLALVFRQAPLLMLGFGMAAVIVVWLAVDVFTNRNRLVQQVIRALED